MVKRKIKVYTKGKNEYMGYIKRVPVKTRKIGNTTFVEQYRICGELYWTDSRLREVFLPHLCIFKLISRGELN